MSQQNALTLQSEKQSQYAVIQSNVFLTDELTDLEKIFISVVSSLSDKNGCCFATNKYLGKTMCKSYPTITRVIASLTKKGFLKSVLIRDYTGRVIRREIKTLNNVFREPNFGEKENIFLGGYYVVIPTDALGDRFITDGQKLLIGGILYLSRPNGYCFATNSYLAKMVNKTKSQVANLLSDLEKKGYLVKKVKRSCFNEVESREIRLKYTVKNNAKAPKTPPHVN